MKDGNGSNGRLTRLLILALVVCSLLIYLFSNFENTYLSRFNPRRLISSYGGSTLPRNTYKMDVTTNLTRITDNNKKNIFLMLIVSTAPKRIERRDAIRKTYWRHCRNNTRVKCLMFTDGKVASDVSRRLHQENNRTKDMIFQPLAGGKEFGLRFLYQIRWAMSHFNFQYLLRVDDDYFICLNRLIHELEHRPKNNLVWGHFYCIKDLVYVDEAFMVFTRDIIERFLSQNQTTMLCHPHADQQIALWLNDIPSRLYFDDKRLHHHPRASHTNMFDKVTYNLCDRFIGIHGAFGHKMIELYRKSKDLKKDKIPSINKFESTCPYKGFKWTEMAGAYRFEPKPCVDQPNWSQGHAPWVGAEEGQW